MDPAASLKQNWRGRWEKNTEESKLLTAGLTSPESKGEGRGASLRRLQSGGEKNAEGRGEKGRKGGGFSNSSLPAKPTGGIERWGEELKNQYYILQVTELTRTRVGAEPEHRHMWDCRHLKQGNGKKEGGRSREVTERRCARSVKNSGSKVPSCTGDGKDDRRGGIGGRVHIPEQNCSSEKSVGGGKRKRKSRERLENPSPLISSPMNQKNREKGQ